MNKINMASCVNSNYITNLSLNVATHVLILFLFLSCFFILYVSKIEQNAFETELNTAISANLNNAFNNLNQNQKTQLKTTLKTIPFDGIEKLYKGQSQEIIINNQWLFRVIVVINVAIILCIIAIATSLMYTCDPCLPIKEILMENAIIFAFVGMIEYMFFTRIALNYAPILPSTMTNTFLTSLQSNLN